LPLTFEIPQNKKPMLTELTVYLPGSQYSLAVI